jgi:hypothetical protein
MRVLLFTAWAVSLSGVTVLADKPPHADKHGDKHPGKHGVEHGAKKEEHNTGFSARDRERARVYFAGTHGRGNCPPGLAKKDNGCLPPGQAKKRYAVGHPLDRSIIIQQVPVALRTRLGPAPAGYRYGVVDGDVLKLVVGTLLVIDAIEGLAR